jgi:hypothetical protein
MAEKFRRNFAFAETFLDRGFTLRAGSSRFCNYYLDRGPQYVRSGSCTHFRHSHQLRQPCAALHRLIERLQLGWRLQHYKQPGDKSAVGAANSDQSPPNYLSTGPSDNYAGNITFTFTSPTSRVGIGISEDGVTPVTLTAYGAAGNVLGSFTQTVSPTTFNAYYVLSDPTFDIKSFSVSASQNLAIDDVQFAVAPEPASSALAGAALILLSVRKRSQRAVRYSGE